HLSGPSIMIDGHSRRSRRLFTQALRCILVLRGLYALKQLLRLSEQCPHELPLGDGLLRASSMAIVAVFVPWRGATTSAPPCSLPAQSTTSLKKRPRIERKPARGARAR